jgi:hypothetical protein
MTARSVPFGEVSLRLFNSAFLLGLGLAFCSACGGRATQAEHVSATQDADASEASAAESCGGTWCSGVCTDLTADPGHCGSCTNVCGSPFAVCDNGTCRGTN